MAWPNQRRESPSQTAGPYVHIGCMPNFGGIAGVYAADLGAAIVGAETPGERIGVSGVVFDGAGTPLRDAMIEVWQADAQGRYPFRHSGGPGGVDPGFSGFGRRASDPETGVWSFETVRPGPVAGMAPHLTFWIAARGINIGLQTRMYFPENAEANASDPVLARIEHKDRIETLIAIPDGAGRYRFDIRLQGDRETVFFDL